MVNIWAKYMVTEDDLTLVGGYTMQYTGHASQKYILETYIILLNNVTLINLIKKKIQYFKDVSSPQIDLNPNQN